MPIAGKSAFFEIDEYIYPKPLVEIKGKPMIEWVVDDLSTIDQDKRFIFVVNKKDCLKFHLNNILKLLTDGNCDIVEIEDSKGAACSALMAIEHINNDNQLIISNTDQIIDVDFNSVIDSFERANVDAGVICFKSIHPQWSYAKTIDDDDQIIETAEKRPISKNAIAGFYYYSKGRDFVESAMISIEKNASINEIHYIAPTLNELILKNKKLTIHKIADGKYYSFYTPQKIKDFERSLR